MKNRGTPRRTTRREALCQAGTGLGMLGLLGLLGDSGYLGKATAGADVADRQKSGPPISAVRSRPGRLTFAHCQGRSI